MAQNHLILSLISKVDLEAALVDRALGRALIMDLHLGVETAVTTEAETRDAMADEVDRAAEPVEKRETTEVVVWEETTVTRVENPARIKVISMAATREIIITLEVET
jgi:hypothetical protein